MRYLWADWDKIKTPLMSKKDKLILLDFDGTLLPIANSPPAVFLNPETKQVLKELSKTPHRRLAIVSGRPMKELYPYLGLSNVLYVANHGLEVKGRGMSLPPAARKARRMNGLIQLLAQKFESVFGGCYEGLLIENKHFTLSLHYRNLPKEQQVYFKRLVQFLREKYKAYPLTWMHGKKVWEVQPSVFWGKGDAARYLMKKFPRAIPVAIGDDRADEDMFSVVRDRGIPIRVGRLNGSKARYYLESPYDVRVFLRKLCR